MTSRDLEERWAASRGRLQRVRNTLVHGGPVSTPLVATVAPSGRQMAQWALQTTLEGLLGGRGPPRGSRQGAALAGQSADGPRRRHGAVRVAHRTGSTARRPARTEKDTFALSVRAAAGARNAVEYGLARAVAHVGPERIGQVRSPCTSASQISTMSRRSGPNPVIWNRWPASTLVL